MKAIAMHRGACGLGGADRIGVIVGRPRADVSEQQDAERDHRRELSNHGPALQWWALLDPGAARQDAGSGREVAAPRLELLPGELAPGVSLPQDVQRSVAWRRRTPLGQVRSLLDNLTEEALGVGRTTGAVRSA